MHSKHYSKPFSYVYARPVQPVPGGTFSFHPSKNPVRVGLPPSFEGMHIKNRLGTAFESCRNKSS